MGRKKKYTEMVAVMVMPETLTQLEKVTDEQEVSKSEFIRGLIEEELNKKQLKKKGN